LTPLSTDGWIETVMTYLRFADAVRDGGVDAAAGNTQ
jgi:hypothetical protein